MTSARMRAPALDFGMRAACTPPPVGSSVLWIAQRIASTIVVEKQREQEGIIAPKSIRTTAVLPLDELVREYESDLQVRGLDEKHVHDTTTRLRRICAENGWRLISDVRPGRFVE